MIPHVFEGCFGWLHPGGGTKGIVLCPTIGHENMIAHRGWRILAENLASRGFDVIRFDYHGIGDSAGSELDPDQLAAWRASIPAAVSHLRQITDVGPVILVGLRLGATLALLAAETIEGVAGVACLAPVLSGRKYIRELSLMAKSWRSLNLLPEILTPTNHLDVLGNRLTARTLRDLAALQLNDLQLTGKSILLMQDDSNATSTEICARLEQQGCQVSRQSFPGALDYLQDALSSDIPTHAFEMVVRWCEQVPLISVPADRRRPDLPPSALSDQLVLPDATEQPFWFGASGSLFGILCRAGDDPSGPVVIMPNTGFGRHVGDGRVFVTLARRLAALGVSSLRMDLGGFGDSADRSTDGPDPYASGNAGDLIAAVAALEAAGYAAPLLVGICSGAYSAFHAMLQEPRIRAAVLVNLQKFIWSPAISLRVQNAKQRRPIGFYLIAATRRAAWSRLVKGDVEFGLILIALCKRPVANLYRNLCVLMERVLRIETSSGQIMRWFKRLKTREVSLCLLYSEGDPGLSELAHQLGGPGARRRRFPNVKVGLLSAADHALLEYEARNNFIYEVCRFVQQTTCMPEAGSRRNAVAPISAGGADERQIALPATA